MSALAYGANQTRARHGRLIPARAGLNDMQHINNRVGFFRKRLRITQCFERADREINRHQHSRHAGVGIRNVHRPVWRQWVWQIHSLFPLQFVQGEIQLQNVHARLAEKAKAGGIGVRADQRQDLFHTDIAGFGNARRL